MPTDLLDRFELPELVELPAWADPQLVRSASAVAIVAALIALFLALRVIRRLALRAVVVVLLAALSIGLWEQRTNLADCAAACSCSVFGQPLVIPAELNPNCGSA
ncbi:MAG: hypothetical protein OSA36_01760 [Acidimicrobiales bacterium]|nr:hypothetical protein [Acidimicrobiales bacterium]